MEDEISGSKFNSIKHYVSFLLKHKFDETCQEYQKLLLNGPLPEYIDFSPLTKQESSNIGHKFLKDFFNLVLDDSILIRDPLSSEPPIAPSDNSIELYTGSGISIKRQLLIKLLPIYTSDCQVMVTVMHEAEEFFILLEKEIIQTNNQKIWNNSKNEFLYSIINNSIDGICALDKQLNVLEWNHVLERHHEIKKEKILGKKIFTMIPAYEDSFEADHINRVIAGEKFFYLIDLIRQKAMAGMKHLWHHFIQAMR
jgi:PAS domain-containing protein